jgi:hypothetical protein
MERNVFIELSTETIVYKFDRFALFYFANELGIDFETRAD